MRRVPRKKRPVEKGVPKGYDSKWESELHNTVLKGWKLHTSKVNYVVEHSYTPDFVKIIDSKVIFIEAKGRFWDHAEYSKYIWIKKSLPKHSELIFLFASPHAAMPGAKKRKDGTKFSHAQWAEKNNFRWYSEKSFKETFKTKRKTNG